MADDEDIPSGPADENPPGSIPAHVPADEAGGTEPVPPLAASADRPVGKDAIPPPGAPTRRFGPSAVPVPRRMRGWRHLAPLTGLAMLLGCVWGLLSGGPLPAWRPWWLGGRGMADSSGVAVVIDPGHGGGDSGAVAHGMVEKDLNLDVGQRVARVLRAHSVGVHLTREDDHFITLAERVRQANALPGAIFVSIHFNDASGDGKAVARASGIETFYSENKDAPPSGWVWTSLYGGATHGPTQGDAAAWAVREGQTLADTIQGSLISGTAATNRGIKERGLYVTRRVLGPAVLVEGGFVSHPAEAHLLGDPAYRQKLADSIAEGIMRYLEASRRTLPVTTVAATRAGG